MMFLQLNPIKIIKKENYISIYDGFIRKGVVAERKEVYNTFDQGALIIDVNEFKVRSIWN